MRVPLLGGSTAWIKANPLDRARCKQARWRIVELSSVQTPSNRPFRARLEWSADSDSDLKARVIVPRGTRICLYAASLTIELQSASTDANQVVCTVADGYAVTQNQWEETGIGNGDGAGQALEIPPFAQFVRVDCTDVTQLSAIQIRLLDGQNALRVHLTGNQQPGPGIPIGEANALTVEAPAGLVYRATFLLAL
jgi:hypothetical protein